MAKNVRRGRGEGSIVKRPDGRWEARLDMGIVNGRRRHRSLYGRTRNDVAAALRHAHTTLEAGVPLPDGRTTVAIFLRHWVTNVLPGTVREAILDSYRSNVEVHLIPALGHIRLRQLTPEHVEQLLQAKAAAGLSANSRRLIRATLRRALGVAERRGQVARNVAALVDGPRTDTPKRRALTVDQAHRLLLAIRDDRFEALYLLLLELGLRKGEALGLQWRDLDLRARTVTVVRSLGRHGVMDDDGRRHTQLIAAATKRTDQGERFTSPRCWLTPSSVGERFRPRSDWPQEPAGRTGTSSSPRRRVLHSTQPT
ncbi:MAG: hypothetical protein NVS3B12_27820 [Acidimicrobiales bacterium]